MIQFKLIIGAGLLAWALYDEIFGKKGDENERDNEKGADRAGGDSGGEQREVSTQSNRSGRLKKIEGGKSDVHENKRNPTADSLGDHIPGKRDGAPGDSEAEGLKEEGKDNAELENDLENGGHNGGDDLSGKSTGGNESDDPKDS